MMQHYVSTIDVHKGGIQNRTISRPDSCKEIILNHISNTELLSWDTDNISDP